MTADLLTAATPFALALGAVGLFVVVPVLFGKGIKRADDRADLPFSEPHEAHVREAIALANDEPDPDFIARTRRLVVDELAQRRQVTS
jgi:hypothetical protein